MSGKKHLPEEAAERARDALRLFVRQNGGKAAAAAHQLGIHPSNVTRALKGKQGPSEATLNALARALQQTPDQILWPQGRALDLESVKSGDMGIGIRRPKLQILEHVLGAYPGRWSQWTIDAVRAGYCGLEDLPNGDEWIRRLDATEAHMAAGRSRVRFEGRA